MKKIAVLMLSSILLIGCAQQEVMDQPTQTNNLKSQVINGTPSVLGARPYQVALLSDDESRCGGVILNEQWVLTAGHCVKDNLKVRAGSIEFTRGGQLISVVEAIKHPEYENAFKGHDIAVLKLSKSLQFNKNVQPAVLPNRLIESRYAKLGTNLIISGWGMTKGRDRDSVSDVLREAPMPVISNSDCNKQLGKTIIDGMMCGDKNKSGQTGCHGDSGGPYAGKGNGKTYVFGLVSWGVPNECSKATVFTRVSRYQPWITKMTGVQPGQVHHPSPECEGLKTFNGSFTQEKQDKFHNGGEGFQCSGKMKAVLSSSAIGDFDLFLQMKDSTDRWVDVERSVGSSNNEQITHNASEGTYRWRVHSYRGTGDYKLVGSRK